MSHNFGIGDQIQIMSILLTSAGKDEDNNPRLPIHQKVQRRVLQPDTHGQGWARQGSQLLVIPGWSALGLVYLGLS